MREKTADVDRQHRCQTAAEKQTAAAIRPFYPDWEGEQADDLRRALYTQRQCRSHANAQRPHGLVPLLDQERRVWHVHIIPKGAQKRHEPDVR